MNDGVSFFMGILLGSIMAWMITIECCVDNDSGKPGQACYRNQTCNEGLICQELTDHSPVCTKPIPGSMGNTAHAGVVP